MSEEVQPIASDCEDLQLGQAVYVLNLSGATDGAEGVSVSIVFEVMRPRKAVFSDKWITYLVASDDAIRVIAYGRDEGIFHFRSESDLRQWVDRTDYDLNDRDENVLHAFRETRIVNLAQRPALRIENDGTAKNLRGLVHISVNVHDLVSKIPNELALGALYASKDGFESPLIYIKMDVSEVNGDVCLSFDTETKRDRDNACMKAFSQALSKLDLTSMLP